MLDYNPGKFQFAFIWTLKGSVFPRACVYAIPAGMLATGLKLLEQFGLVDEQQFFILENNAAYSGFSFVVGFLLIFRTSQAYGRFWDGATKVNEMRSKWCDSYSSLIAFSRKSEKPQKEVLHFQHVLLRLFSLLHSLALQRIHGMYDEAFDIIDIDGLEEHTMKILEKCPMNDRLDVVAMWIQQLIVDNLDSGILNVPGPVQSRVFQEMSNGMLAFNNTLKIATTPFPFPYAQMTTVLLLVHLILTPLLMIEWTSGAGWAFTWSFTVVLCSWCINFIAVEMEQPFGGDINDLPTHEMQDEMNEALLFLVDPRCARLPKMKDTAVWDVHKLIKQYVKEEEISLWQIDDRGSGQQMDAAMDKVTDVFRGVPESLGQVGRLPQQSLGQVRSLVSGGSSNDLSVVGPTTGNAAPAARQGLAAAAPPERREELRPASAPSPLVLPESRDGSAASPIQAAGNHGNAAKPVGDVDGLAECAVVFLSSDEREKTPGRPDRCAAAAQDSISIVPQNARGKMTMSDSAGQPEARSGCENGFRSDRSSSKDRPLQQL